MFFIELEPVFNNEGFSQGVDFTLDMSDCYFNGGFPFTDGVRITGEVKNSTDIVSLVAKAEFTLNLTCDRCAADFSRTREGRYSAHTPDEGALQGGLCWYLSPMR